MTGKCIIFSAPSGAGKTTIVKELLQKPELKLEFSISATTRLPRGQEINGIDYYFLPINDFKNKIEQHEFVEWEEVYQNSFYGTLAKDVERIWNKGNYAAFDVDVKGGLSLKKKFGANALAIFLIPPSVETLEQRLRGRGTDSEEKILERLAKAKYELTFAPQFDVQIVNRTIEECVDISVKKIQQFLKA